MASESSPERIRSQPRNGLVNEAAGFGAGSDGGDDASCSSSGGFDPGTPLWGSLFGPNPYAPPPEPAGIAVRVTTPREPEPRGVSNRRPWPRRRRATRAHWCPSSPMRSWPRHRLILESQEEVHGQVRGLVATSSLRTSTNVYEHFIYAISTRYRHLRPYLALPRNPEGSAQSQRGEATRGTSVAKPWVRWHSQ